MNFLLNKRVTISMLFIALTLLGYVSYKHLPVELYPNAEAPMLYVAISYPQEMDPAYVESEVVIPLEGAVSSVGGTEEIRSEISSTRSSITIQFKHNVNLKVTSLRLEEKLNETAATLPEGFRAFVQKVDLSSMARNSFMSLQVRGSGGVDRVRNVVDEEIRRDLENIDGVAGIQIYGGREKAIEIRLDKEACKSLNITTGTVSNLLRSNQSERVFVGNVKESDNQYFVHVNATYDKVSDIENVVVAPGPVFLKDVATVFFDLKEETSYSRVNGKEAVSISVINDAQANLIDLSHRTQQVVEQLNEKLAAQDIEIVIDSNTADTMEENINQIIHLALIGGVLAVFVLWFFLKNRRLVFFIALSMPISIFTAFNLFYYADISINSLTLVGMALAVGMLLDNSVVVLENIYRLSGNGETPEKSVTQGTKEVWRSIVAATLTTITVFLPFVFSDNFLLKLMGQHVGVSIISTMFISMLVALLFVPMTAYFVLKNKNRHSVFYERVSLTQRPVQIYLVLLKTCMRNPGATIFGSIILLFVVLIWSLSNSLSTNREVNADRFNINVTMRTGSTLENTDNVVKILEERLNEIPEKKDVISRINEEDAVLTLILQENYKKIGKRNMADIKADAQSKMPDMPGTEIYVSDAMSGGGQGGGDGMSGAMGLMRLMGLGDNRERVIIKGSDFDMMQLVAEDIRYYLDEQDFIRNSWVSYSQRQPEIRLNFDQVLLTSYDISRQNIISGLNSLETDFSSGTTFRIGDKSYDIIIRNEPPEVEEEEKNRPKTMDDLVAVQIPSNPGGLYALNDIATINKTFGRSRIIRVNQDKQIEVQYNFIRSVENSTSLIEGYRTDIDQLIENYNLPSGIAIEVIHEEDMFADFKFLFIAAFVLIFMILAIVFESVTTPFVMLFAVPLAAIGSLLALAITGNSLMNANTLIGFVILIGVVTNNGIILIDYANILRKRGFRRERALMTAGLSRIRPILITSITTTIAMFPLAMGGSEYAGAIGAPFAITVIGGLAFSTLLTLVMVPTVNMGLESALTWYRTISKKLKIIHLILVLAGLLSIYLYVSSLLYQLLYFVALVTLVPGVTYFIQTSLRMAKSNIVDPNKEINIVIRNIVKIYDRAGQFSRQWESGLLMNKRLGIASEYHSLKDFMNIGWLFGLWGFAIYFAFFFISSKLWCFLLSFAIYALTLSLWHKIREFLFYKYPDSKVIRIINRCVFWLIPVFILFGLFRKLENPSLLIIVAFLWLVGILIYITSKYLYDKNVNIERVTGRFVKLKRSWFRMVKSIPLIGKRRKPFKALRGVSFEIRTGMFGLLGPNGAGKSTLMRIVTGILEQSYGSIWINGLDTRVYREELQSLIGFLPQEFGTYENMSAYEFLDYQAILKGLTDTKIRKERIEYVLQSVHLLERKNDKIGSFSGGMKQRIGIALILLHLPRILVVDEPTAGLDPRERIRFRNLLVELSKDRIVIFSTHIIEDISSSCNQVVVINKGELKYFGVPEKMVNMAEGKVWKFLINKESFEQELDKSMIINNIQDGDMIQVRYLSLEKPYPGAEQAEANLEDAYLCLLKNM
ncbi:MAG: efflux RND transporter permease subunit [Tannerella sp.]|jgi:multidrug efflux pump subunit AcrB/ABC-type multidrug transport system ATPase subunit|nr:efflux RND transporter permease subunit [Tannerella sp.]